MKASKFGASLLALTVSMGTAFAQGAGDNAGDLDSGDEIVVIGNRFQNSLVNRLPIDPKELPFSIDIIDEATIEERGFLNPFDILETVPNVVPRQTQSLPGGSAYLIRGLFASALTNNRPESNSRGAGRREISFIERIEIAKGPTSILLGPVIPGGVVNQVTKTPEEDAFVDLTFRGGSFDTYRGEFDGNVGSLFGTDAIGFRLTAAYEDLGSPQELENTETFAIRPVFEIDLSERTRFQGSVAYTEREGGQGSRLPANADGSIPDVFDPETFLGVYSERKGRDVYYDGELQHEFLDNLKLVVRGSYQNADFEYNTAQSGYNYAGGRGFQPGDTNAYVYNSRGERDQDVTFADAQIVGGFDALGQRQDWVVGGTFKREETISLFGFVGQLGVVDINNIDAAVFAEPDFSVPLNPFFTREDDLYSVYAETNLRPTDRLTIVAGVRYDEFEQENLRGGNTTSETYDDVTFRSGITYAVTDALNGYFSYAESFIPQGGTTAAGDAIEPETATNFEIGIKGGLFDGRVNLTAAAFMLTRQNVATVDPNRQPGQPISFIATGEQEHNGFEVSANIDITDALGLNLAYGYVDTEITEVIDAGNGQDVGDPVALVPNHTFSVYGSYTVPTGPLADLRVGLGARGISERPSPRFDIDYDGYTLVDANIAYPFNDVFEVQLNVLNLLDERYRASIGFDSGTPGGGHRFGNPRAAYVTLRARL